MPTEARATAHHSSVDLSPISQLLAVLKDQFDPNEIWLFGSRARGEASEGSDWDLLVVVPDGTAAAVMDPLVAWRARKRAGVPADVIVCTESEFRDDRETVNTVAFSAGREGFRVYERRPTHRE